MQLPPLTRHVPKDELEAFMAYAEDNYSTVFEPLNTPEPDPDNPAQEPGLPSVTPPEP
ncbi:MAG: hypothetical protein P4L36_06995 [Holophaga sp.]|nr:hypothetical protein [Holophaga sp.]